MNPLDASEEDRRDRATQRFNEEYRKTIFLVHLSNILLPMALIVFCLILCAVGIYIVISQLSR